MYSRSLAGAATVVGLLLAAIGLVAAPATALTGVVIGAVVGGVASVGSRERSTADAATASRRSRRTALFAGGAFLGTWLVVSGLMVLLGPATGAVLLPILMVVVAVWLWRRRARLRGGRNRWQPTTRPGPAPVVAPPPVPSELSTKALCSAWQRSYFTLLDAPPGPARAEIVAARELLLDEIERRDSQGFSRWLETGARAGSDPGRYLTTDR